MTISAIILHTGDAKSRELSLERVRATADIRIWTVNTDRGILFAVAEVGGETFAIDVVEIELR